MVKYSADQLLDDIEVVSTIYCNKCNESDSAWMCDEYYASEDFFKKGWRRTLNYLYCPACAKKYLKS